MPVMKRIKISWEYSKIVFWVQMSHLIRYIFTVLYFWFFSVSFGYSKLQSANVESSLIMICLSKMTGWAQVWLSATVYWTIGSNPSALLLTTNNLASFVRKNNTSPALRIAAFSPCRSSLVQRVEPVLTSRQKKCPPCCRENPKQSTPPGRVLQHEQ